MHTTVTEAKSEDKFIAFFDVLGWKHLVRDMEQQNNFSLMKAVSILDMVNHVLQSRKEMLLNDRPEICPSAPHIRSDIGFCFTTFSDSVVLSTEISQAGLVNLINCCRAIYFKLITRTGLMCRGYVGRGPIYHTEDHCIGSGLGDVVEGEKNVSMYQTEEGEVGTPFIEVDQKVLQFLDKEVTDSCVTGVLEEIVKRKDGVAVIFPFKSLDPGRFGSANLDRNKARQHVDVVRKWIEDAKKMIARHVDSSDEKVLRRANCLAEILNEQLMVCKSYEEAIGQMSEEFPAHSFEPKYFPGLFDTECAAKSEKQE